jgi:hypothetical protein
MVKRKMRGIIIKQVLIVIVFILLCLNGLAAEKKELNAAIIHGPNIVFTIAAPGGWTLDTKSGEKDALPAVLYPKGSSWEKSPVVMYINNVPKDTQPSPNLDDFIKDEIESFKKKHPKILIRDGKPLRVRGGRLAVVKEFSGDKWGNYEAVAYISEDKTFTSLTLSAKTKDDYINSFPSFEEFVGSYTFLTSDVRIK